MLALIIENNTAYRDLLDHTPAQQGFETDTDELRLTIEALKPKGLTITTCIGVTSLEVGVEQDFEDMFHADDEGVYKAKENGRNQVVYVGLD